MSAPIKISNYKQKQLAATQYNQQRDENALQQQLFLNMDKEGLLKVNSIGASVDIYSRDLLIARMICSSEEKAIIIQEYMMKYIFEHQMKWSVKINQVEILG